MVVNRTKNKMTRELSLRLSPEAGPIMPKAILVVRTLVSFLLLCQMAKGTHGKMLAFIDHHNVKILIVLSTVLSSTGIGATPLNSTRPKTMAL